MNSSNFKYWSRLIESSFGKLVKHSSGTKHEVVYVDTLNKGEVGFPVMFDGKHGLECNDLVTGNVPIYQVQIGEMPMYIEGKKLRELLLDNAGNGVVRDTPLGRIFVVKVGRQILLDSQVES